MRNDAERRFNEVVADMMSQGWVIDCSRGFNQGHQGEINKVAFTKGKEVKVVWLSQEHDWREDKKYIILEVKSYNDLHPYEDIVWYNRGETELVEKFIEVSSNSRRSNTYVVAEGTESEEILAKQKSRRANRWDSMPQSTRPFLVDKATEILRNSGIYGTKSEKVVTVRRTISGYNLTTEKKHTYFLGPNGLKKW